MIAKLQAIATALTEILSLIPQVTSALTDFSTFLDTV